MPDLHHSAGFICANAGHHVHRRFFGRQSPTAQILVDDPDLQVDGAEPGHRIGQILALSDQRLERLPLATGASEVHHLEPDLVVAELKPYDWHRSALGALLNEIQCGRVLLPSISEGYDQIVQVLIVVQHLAQHVCAGPAAGKADDRCPGYFVGRHRRPMPGHARAVKSGVRVGFFGYDFRPDRGRPMNRSDFETAINRYQRGERPSKFVTPDWYLVSADGNNYPLKYVYAMARGIEPADTHTDDAKLAARAAGFVVVNVKDPQSEPLSDRLLSYWWVNHKRTHKREIQRGLIWSPKRNRDGGHSEAYENMTKIRSGDIVISYANTKIRAVGTATAACTEAAIPDDHKNEGDYWDDVGWQVPIEWAALTTPISPKQHLGSIASLLPTKYSPLRSTGDGNQGRYLSSISEDLGLVILGIAKEQDPASLSRMHFAVELHDELDRRLENQQQESIENDLSIPETVRKQLVNARIGQGEFRLRTYAIEPRCRLTGVSNSSFLTASHIKPWKNCSNQERLDGNNGLMLAPHVDRLFDRGWISFEDNGDVLVAKEAIPALHAWGLSETANVGEFTEKQRVYLAYHRGFLLKD